MQILAGNARKVSAVRFEHISNDEEMLETRKVTHWVPKIMKRKWSSDEDSLDAENDEDASTRSRRPQDALSGKVDD